MGDELDVALLPDANLERKRNVADTVIAQLAACRRCAGRWAGFRDEERIGVVRSFDSVSPAKLA